MAAGSDVSKLCGLVFLSCFLLLPTVCVSQEGDTNNGTEVLQPNTTATSPGEGGEEVLTTKVPTQPPVELNTTSSAVEVDSKAPTPTPNGTAEATTAPGEVPSQTNGTTPAPGVVPSEANPNTTVVPSKGPEPSVTTKPATTPAVTPKANTTVEPQPVASTESKTEKASTPQETTKAITKPSTTTEYVAPTKKATPVPPTTPVPPPIRTEPPEKMTTQTVPPVHTTIQGATNNVTNTTQGDSNKVPQYHDNQTLDPALAFFVAVLVILVVIALVATIWWKQRRANFQTIGGDVPMSWFSKSGKRGFERLDDTEPMLDDLEESHLIANAR
ncbi:PREDICTED: platelet glycoprotein Ib alpha chain-like isoform X1 [Branchiostoma belcheri]|uniref:Platelet glycoprotein Ib alpha chain-like isoform X1 n=1 Tax=Branchiostoma belcheri TaxID=7741 RepID=A0A6P4ZWY5_BRABE|nr:PREDICTED: platelet glycoprotein Ib alpha chain-like isoform X1 [Branchiostoma belcheri]